MSKKAIDIINKYWYWIVKGLLGTNIEVVLTQ